MTGENCTRCVCVCVCVCCEFTPIYMVHELCNLPRFSGDAADNTDLLDTHRYAWWSFWYDRMWRVGVWIALQNWRLRIIFYGIVGRWPTQFELDVIAIGLNISCQKIGSVVFQRGPEWGWTRLSAGFSSYLSRPVVRDGSGTAKVAAAGIGTAFIWLTRIDFEWLKLKCFYSWQEANWK